MDIYNPSAIGVTAGFGVPTGGTSGQVLVKNSSTNYDSSWINYGEWVNGGVVSISATSTPPTKGTVVQDNVRYRRVNTTTWEVEYKYAQSTVGNAGSGTYVFALPSGIAFGASVILSTSATVSVLQNSAIPATATQAWGGPSLRPLMVVPRTSNSFQMITLNGTFNSGIVSSANGDWVAGTTFMLRFYVDTN